MTAETYGKISVRLRKNKNAVVAINIINRALTILVYIAYPVLIAYLFFFNRSILPYSLFVPAVSFVLVSVLRKLINRPRPYEKLDIQPLINKEKSGCSMPSRHVFSAFVIGFAFMYLSPAMSLPFFIIGFVLALIRFVGGVHYLSDVLVGAAIGIISGLIGLIIM